MDKLLTHEKEVFAAGVKLAAQLGGVFVVSKHKLAALRARTIQGSSTDAK